MASEPTDGGTVSARLPDDLDAWLDERAEELGLAREDLFRRLLSAYQVVAAADGEEFGSSGETAGLEQRLDRLERTHRENLEDVRKRVLQVKTLAEGKAAADHDHEAFDRLDVLESQFSTLTERVESLTETTERLADGDHGEPGDGRDDLDRKLTTVARAVVKLRRDVATLRERELEMEQRVDAVATEGVDSEGNGSRDGETAVVDQSPPTPSPDDEMAGERLLELKRLAAREGYETASCGACGETAHVSLLPEPACPACQAPIYDIVDEGGLRSKPTLVGEGSVTDE